MDTKTGCAAVGIIVWVAMWLFSITLIYGVVIIIFRYAFGVELWNPFHG
jgi:hypothetical protein